MEHDAEVEAVVDQLAAELGARRASLIGMIPVADASMITNSVRAAAARVSRRLCPGEPCGRAASVQVVHALWGDGSPPPSWWHTPLGRAVAACGASGPEQVPYRSTR